MMLEIKELNGTITLLARVDRFREVVITVYTQFILDEDLSCFGLGDLQDTIYLLNLIDAALHEAYTNTKNHRETWTS